MQEQTMPKAPELSGALQEPFRPDTLRQLLKIEAGSSVYIANDLGARISSISYHSDQLHPDSLARTRRIPQGHYQVMGTHTCQLNNLRTGDGQAASFMVLRTAQTTIVNNDPRYRYDWETQSVVMADLYGNEIPVTDGSIEVKINESTTPVTARLIKTTYDYYLVRSDTSDETELDSGAPIEITDFNALRQLRRGTKLVITSATQGVPASWYSPYNYPSTTRTQVYETERIVELPFDQPLTYQGTRRMTLYPQKPNRGTSVTGEPIECYVFTTEGEPQKKVVYDQRFVFNPETNSVEMNSKSDWVDLKDRPLAELDPNLPSGYRLYYLRSRVKHFFVPVPTSEAE